MTARRALAGRRRPYHRWISTLSSGATPADLDRQLGLVRDVGIALTRSAPLAEQLAEAVQALVSHLDAAFARIWTLRPGESVLKLQASAGLYTHLDGGHSQVPVGMFKIGLIAAERQAHLTNDVPNDPRVSDQAWAAREGMVAFAGYPLLVGARLVGVMAMFSKQRLPPVTLDALALVARHRRPDAVIVSVHDDGIGIPPAELPEIFEPFKRAANATKRQLPGLGLGLHICRQIVERHGGRIWAESGGDHSGTTFYVSLPTVPTAAGPATAGR